MGITPNELDVGTNGLPEEVRRLFRNCRLIGRRFRLSHVHFGHEIIEVATFRAAAAPEREDSEDVESDSVNEGGVTDRAAEPDIPEITAPNDSEHRAFDERELHLRVHIY